MVTSGTIAAGTGVVPGDAVKFSAASTLVIDPGAVFDGDVVTNSSVSVVLASGGNGTVSGLGTTLTGLTNIT